MRLGLRWLERRYLDEAPDFEVAAMRLFGDDEDADALEAERALAEAMSSGDRAPLMMGGDG